MPQLELKPIEVLFLWRLAATGGEAWNKEVKPALEAPARKRLEAARLVEAVKRKPPGGRAAALALSLTDEGWEWLGTHLDADLNTRTPAGVEVFRLFLLGLKRYLDRSDVSLGDLLAPAPAPAPALDGEVAALATRAYYAASGGRPNVRVRLAELRRALPAVPRAALDRALLDLQTRGEATLYRLDDPREIRPEDRDAVFHTPSGEERHVVYLGGRGS
ncbi:hypothetical protein [Paludisphaera mucosa]|uniref:HTH marR-type domain-containing protein n=1 Tax=Paludisphaera mucosa TaxID=3030827 RepID=A0ABT6FJ81_9BACT|nr:hypothetical protein [Paludisphaera mucosa]MDG3007610.1 hypothetical protein [Paludisphaera mucosa]